MYIYVYIYIYIYIGLPIYIYLCNLLNRVNYLMKSLFKYQL